MEEFCEHWDFFGRRTTLSLYIQEVRMKSQAFNTVSLASLPGLSISRFILGVVLKGLV